MYYRALFTVILIASLTTSGCSAPDLTAPRDLRRPVAPTLSIDVGYGPDLFYYLRHAATPDTFTTFGTVAASGSVVERFGVGSNVRALAFAPTDLGYGPNQFYALRRVPNTDFTWFGTVSLSGAVTDRFGVGNNLVALTWAAPDLGYGPNLFYYVRRDPLTNATVLGTISTSGAVVDRFGIGLHVIALTFVAPDLGYGPNLFYYVRRDPLTGSTLLGTTSASGAVVDRFGTGLGIQALAFAGPNLGWGPNLLYYLRSQPGLTAATTFGTISLTGTTTDRFGIGGHVAALAFADEPGATQVSLDVLPGLSPNVIFPGSLLPIPVAILSTPSFDARQIDPRSVRFGRTGAEAAAIATLRADVNADGRFDTLLIFRTRDTAIRCGERVGHLSGTTFRGQRVSGSDAIVTLGCPS